MRQPPPEGVLNAYAECDGLSNLRYTDGGFSGAGVWRIESVAGRWALRQWPSDSPPVARLASLHHFLQGLQEQGLKTIAPPLQNRSGASLMLWGETWWQLEPWLPGAAEPSSSPTTARLSAAMIALQDWHAAAARFRAEGAGRAWFAGLPVGLPPAAVERIPKLRALLGVLRRLPATLPLPGPEWHDVWQRLIAGCWRRGPGLLTQLERAARQPVPLQICLRDVWRDHVLFTGDEVTGLIDPSASRWDTVTADLSRLLGSLVGDQPEAWRSAIATYESQRPLSAAERVLLPVLDQSGVVLSAGTWIQRLIAGNAPVGPALLARLRSIASRLETLRVEG